VETHGFDVSKFDAASARTSDGKFPIGRFVVTLRIHFCNKKNQYLQYQKTHIELNQTYLDAKSKFPPHIIDLFHVTSIKFMQYQNKITATSTLYKWNMKKAALTKINPQLGHPTIT